MFVNTPENHEVAYACGHSVTRVKSERNASNTIVKRVAARSLCEACLGEHEARRKDMISNSIQRTKEAVTGTKLTGSKKQIKWAVSIRANWLDIFNHDIPPYSLKLSFEKAQLSAAVPDSVETGITNVLVIVASPSCHRHR